MSSDVRGGCRNDSHEMSVVRASLADCPSPPAAAGVAATEHNNAVTLKEFVDGKIGASRRSAGTHRQQG